MSSSKMHNTSIEIGNSHAKKKPSPMMEQFLQEKDPHKEFLAKADNTKAREQHTKKLQQLNINTAKGDSTKEGGCGHVSPNAAALDVNSTTAATNDMARSSSGKDNVAYLDFSDLVKISRRQSKLFKTNACRSIIPGPFNDESEIQDDEEDDDEEDDDEEDDPSRTKDLSN
ncbi:MAG: hypothetical protein Q9172_007023 [Xanthocarpia lactea]